MSTIIGACLVVGCMLLALSLPLGGLPLARSMRRWALVCFVAAFVPSVACNLAAAAVGHGGAGAPSAGGMLAGIGLLAILAVVAYVILAARGRISRTRRRAPESWRSRRGYQYDDEPRRGWWDDDEE